MLFKNWKKAGIVILGILALGIIGCTNNDGEGSRDASIGEQVNYTITGIDAGAGVVQAAEQAVEDYGLDYRVQTSSGAAMTQALSDAIEKQEPIIVTGWNPHWKFAKYDLKYLEDPKGSFGEAENIHTIARLGLAEDKPEAYAILDNFYWEGSEMEAVMIDINEGEDPNDVARQWVEDHQERVSQWTDGVEKVDGQSIELAYVAWDTEIASTNVIGAVLEDMGYDVKLTQVDNGPMWEAIASGNVDAIVAAWLPGTHGDHYENFKERIDDLGPNLEGAAIGLVVPSYMEINSIEDLAE